MRQGQQNRRGRGRNRSKGQSPLSRSFESTGPDVKIRGTASHIAEKYMSLARDASSSGDSVMAENYLQHAEHYNRIIMAAQSQSPQPNDPMGGQGHRPRSINDIDYDDDDGDDQPGVGGGYAEASYQGGQDRDRYERGDRDREMNGSRNDRESHHRDRDRDRDRDRGHHRQQRTDDGPRDGNRAALAQPGMDDQPDVAGTDDNRAPRPNRQRGDGEGNFRNRRRPRPNNGPDFRANGNGGRGEAAATADAPHPKDDAEDTPPVA